MVGLIDAITSDDIRRLGAELLARERLSLVALGADAGPSSRFDDLFVGAAA